MAEYKYNHFISNLYLKGFQTSRIEKNGYKSQGCYFWDFNKNPSGDLDKKIFSITENIGGKNYIFNDLDFKNGEKIFDPKLEKEFQNLEVPFSKILKEIRNSYKNFMKTKKKGFIL